MRKIWALSSLLSFALAACGSPDSTDVDAGAGGTTATGGHSGDGGTTGSAGAAGGASGTGGPAGTSGGTAGVSGTSGTAGSSGTAGASGTTGTTGTTGTAGTGGHAGTGGTAGTSGGTGGSPPAAVRIVGRTAPGTTSGSTTFEWSGTSINARFTGTQISIMLSDGNNQNEFAVIVDGGTPTKLITANGTTTYPLATGLADATHTLVVWRCTEAKFGPTTFLGLTGFSAGGALLPPAAAPDHRIEVIGDSITSGVGIEQTGTCSGTETNQNDYLAYGSVAARALGADVVTIAWQGIGMYRNYNEAGPVAGDPTMPQRYDYAIPTAMTAWSFALYQPQAVVINLTSNDFSTNGDPGTPYITAYRSFLAHVRSNYPDAYFFLVIEYSNGSLSSATDTNTIVSMEKAAGNTKIESFDIRPYANGNACEGHPDTAGGQSMGTALAAEIKKVLAW
jgi:hypothetical protein